MPARSADKTPPGARAIPGRRPVRTHHFEGHLAEQPPGGLGSPVEVDAVATAKAVGGDLPQSGTQPEVHVAGGGHTPPDEPVQLL